MSGISFDVFTVELKLDALGTPYRTVSIPSFYTFDKLHAMIVWLFQWSDEHAHTFKIPTNKNENEDRSKEQLEYEVYDSSSSLIQNKNDEKEKDKEKDTAAKAEAEAEVLYYWVSNIKSFPTHCCNIKKKLESRVMIQNALRDKNDCIIYQYDFDSNINSNWTVFVTLLATKSIRNLPICDFDPFEFVEIIDGNGKTIPEYDIFYDINDINDNCEYEQELREYHPKRLNEELQIMRSKYTMFYEDYKKNKKKKRKMREKQNEKMVDIIHDTTDNDEDADNEYIDATVDTSTDNETSSYDDDDDDDVDAEFLSTTESDIYHNKTDRRKRDKNDYDHILMYSNKRKIKNNRKKKQYCIGFLILFCIFAWILYYNK